jgi:hypothetical protein
MTKDSVLVPFQLAMLRYYPQPFMRQDFASLLSAEEQAVLICLHLGLYHKKFLNILNSPFKARLALLWPSVIEDRLNACSKASSMLGSG